MIYQIRAWDETVVGYVKATRICKKTMAEQLAEFRSLISASRLQGRIYVDAVVHVSKTGIEDEREEEGLIEAVGFVNWLCSCMDFIQVYPEGFKVE